MTPPQLVLVTQRFWPLVGRAAKVMANLAAELASRKLEVTVLTPRWQSQWPAEIAYRGVPVVRLANPPTRGRAAIGYMASVARWLRQNQNRYDLIYVSMLKHDAYAALAAARRRVPVVLRAERSGRLGDCLWQLDANCGRRLKQRCIKADALIGPSRPIERELIAAGYPRPRIHYLSNGVPIPPEGNAKTKAAARAAFAAVNPRLTMPQGVPLAVYAGRLHEAKGLAELVAAWEPICARWPNARLWLAGEGPCQAQLIEQIDARNLSGRVVLAGVFDSTDELLAAADLLVSPGREDGMSLSLLEAMAAGLPVVATDIPGNRDFVADGRHGLLVPAADVDSLSAAVHRLLDEPELAARLGAAARDRAKRRFSLAGMAAEHLRLFEALLGSNSTARQQAALTTRHSTLNTHL